MNIEGHPVPLSDIRAKNAGDWKTAEHEIVVKMAQSLTDDEQLLVFVHELVEARLCQRTGVTDDQVTAWDEAHLDAEEPGEISGAPYREAHARALEVERHLAEVLKVDWHAYEERLHALFK